MSDVDPKHPPFLRRVTFVDQTPDEPGQLPVSVPSVLFLDGVDHSEVLAYDRGYVIGNEWRITGIPEVLVSFVAYAEHVTTQSYPSKGTSGRTLLSGSHIAGIPVLTPTDHEWEILPPDERGRKRVKVWIYARHLEVLAADQLPPAWEIVPRESHADASN